MDLVDYQDIAEQLRQRLRQVRLLEGWTQATLAKRAGVSLGSLRRFEQSGAISLVSFLKLCQALGRLDDFDAILRLPAARSLADLDLEDRLPKRGRE